MSRPSRAGPFRKVVGNRGGSINHQCLQCSARHERAARRCEINYIVVYSLKTNLPEEAAISRSEAAEDNTLLLWPGAGPLRAAGGLAVQAHRAIRNAIQEGQLEAGQRVPELELCAWLKVSRTPIRGCNSTACWFMRPFVSVWRPQAWLPDPYRPKGHPSSSCDEEVLAREIGACLRHPPSARLLAGCEVSHSTAVASG
jgi:Bacterial regulatory proteins, gntR family